jgi:hypothetical protein
LTALEMALLFQAVLFAMAGIAFVIGSGRFRWLAGAAALAVLRLL